MTLLTMDWPAVEALADSAPREQCSDAAAWCTGLAVCDESLRPTHTFEPGEALHVFAEFQVVTDIGVPIAGIEINPSWRHMSLHGRSTAHEPMVVADAAVGAGHQLRAHFQVELSLAPGTYAFGLWLSSVSEADWRSYVAETLSHDELMRRATPHCRMILAGSFKVTATRNGWPTHAGRVHLPGYVEIADTEASSDTSESLPPSVARMRRDTPPAMPTLVHVTHWKAGSQWIRRILRDCFPEQFVRPQEQNAHFFAWPVQSGLVYPTVYVTRPEFDRAQLPTDWRRFVVIRDLRDTLVSGYFSLRYSHPTHDPYMASWRSRLETMEVADALLLLIDEWLPGNAAIQFSWLESNEPLIRYEDLLDRDEEILTRLFVDEFQLPITRERVAEVVRSCRFERITGGRSRGEEDVHAHARKGIAGDWQQYFTPRLKEAFKLRYGGLLVAAGYEKDLNW